MFGEGGLRVPMIVSWAGKLPSNQTRDVVVSAMDIFPTIVELAGGQIPAGRDGSSLVPLLNGDASPLHDILCFTSGRGSWAIRKGDWKLVRGTGWEHAAFTYDENGFCIRDENPFIYPEGVNLFNLKDDMGETRNPAEVHPDVVEELTDSYNAWRSQMRYTKAEGGIRKGSENK